MPTPMDRDVHLAIALLHGRANKKARIEYLSAQTNPTEKEARAALARVLLAFVKELHPHAALTYGMRHILTGLAHLVDPSGNNSPTKRFWNNRQVKFRDISTRKSTAWKDVTIALEVQMRREHTRTKDEAVERVAEDFGVTARHVKRVIRKSDVKEMLRRLDELRQLPDRSLMT